MGYMTKLINVVGLLVLLSACGQIAPGNSVTLSDTPITVQPSGTPSPSVTLPPNTGGWAPSLPTQPPFPYTPPPVLPSPKPSAMSSSQPSPTPSAVPSAVPSKEPSPEPSPTVTHTPVPQAPANLVTVMCYQLIMNDDYIICVRNEQMIDNNKKK